MLFFFLLQGRYTQNSWNYRFVQSMGNETTVEIGIRGLGEEAIHARRLADFVAESSSPYGRISTVCRGALMYVYIHRCVTQVARGSSTTGSYLILYIDIHTHASMIFTRLIIYSSLFFFFCSRRL